MKQICCCFWLHRQNFNLSTSGGVYIISSVSFVGTLVGIARASFTLIFSLTTR